MKTLGKFLMGLCLMAAVIGFVEGPAFAMRCALWNPITGQCSTLEPDYPTLNVYNGGGAGHDCTGAPGPKEINVYSATNKGGWCVTYVAGSYMDLNSTNGWWSPYYVYGVWVGSAAHGYVYSGAGFTGTASAVTAGQFYNYSSPSGFHGVYNDTAL